MLFYQAVFCAGLSLLLTTMPHEKAMDTDDAFRNPIAEGADPWVIENPMAMADADRADDHRHHRYYWCLSDGNRGIVIHTGNSLTRLGRKHVVWRAPAQGPYSRQIWAPELHFVDGHWYIYLAASDGDNANHLAYVLKSKTSDVLSDYEIHGPLATGAGSDGTSPNIWAIDMTLLRHGGQLYAIWSGWDAPGTDRQYLYIAPMSSPTQLSGPRVRLCDNADYLWERLEPSEEHRGLNEGPEVFQAQGRTFVFYSCGASWLPTYKLGRLELVGEDPLDPAAWKKSEQPAFESNETVYGVGHSCFVRSPDHQQWWHVYHAKQDREPGWRRSIHVQPMDVKENGEPDLGQPHDPAELLEQPSGTLSLGQPLESSKTWSPMAQGADYAYYGHHQFIQDQQWGTAAARLRLGQAPDDPINDYRSGEKVLFAPRVAGVFHLQTVIDFQGNQQSRDAGLLFCCQRPAVGYDSQQAYFAGLIPQTGLVILGKTDGKNWQELGRADWEIDATKPQLLEVIRRDNQIEVRCNGRLALERQDNTYQSGQIGLRVVNSDAVFTELKVRPR